MLWLWLVSCDGTSLRLPPARPPERAGTAAAGWAPWRGCVRDATDTRVALADGWQLVHSPHGVVAVDGDGAPHRSLPPLFPPRAGGPHRGLGPVPRVGCRWVGHIGHGTYHYDSSRGVPAWVGPARVVEPEGRGGPRVLELTWDPVQQSIRFARRTERPWTAAPPSAAPGKTVEGGAWSWAVHGDVLTVEACGVRYARHLGGGPGPTGGRPPGPRPPTRPPPRAMDRPPSDPGDRHPHGGPRPRGPGTRAPREPAPPPRPRLRRPGPRSAPVGSQRVAQPDGRLGAEIVRDGREAFLRTWDLPSGEPRGVAPLVGISGAEPWMLDSTGVLVVGGDGEWSLHDADAVPLDRGEDRVPGPRPPAADGAVGRRAAVPGAHRREGPPAHRAVRAARRSLRPHVRLACESPHPRARDRRLGAGPVDRRVAAHPAQPG